MEKRRRDGWRKRMRLVIPDQIFGSDEEEAANRKRSDEAMRRFVRALARVDEEQDFSRAMDERRKA